MSDDDTSQADGSSDGDDDSGDSDGSEGSRQKSTDGRNAYVTTADNLQAQGLTIELLDDDFNPISGAKLKLTIDDDSNSLDKQTSSDGSFAIPTPDQKVTIEYQDQDDNNQDDSSNGENGQDQSSDNQSGDNDDDGTADSSGGDDSSSAPSQDSSSQDDDTSDSDNSSS